MARNWLFRLIKNCFCKFQSSFNSGNKEQEKLPKPRSHAASTLIDSRIYLFAGREDDKVIIFQADRDTNFLFRPQIQCSFWRLLYRRNRQICDFSRVSIFVIFFVPSCSCFSTLKLQEVKHQLKSPGIRSKIRTNIYFKCVRLAFPRKRRNPKKQKKKKSP